MNNQCKNCVEGVQEIVTKRCRPTQNH